MDDLFKLRLLNGPLQGVELSLPEGPFTLGEKDECELRLSLENNGMAELNVLEDGVHLVSETPCWTGGTFRGKGILPLNEGIDLDGIHFVLFNATSENAPAQVLIPSRKLKKGSPGFISVSIISFFIMTVAGGLLWYMPSSPASPESWLPLALEQNPGIKSTWISKNTLRLTGQCENSNKLQSLINQLRELRIHLYMEAVCTDTLERSIRNVLASFGYSDMIVSVDKTGNAVISGYFSGDLKPLAEYLDRLPGLKNWQLSEKGTQELSVLVGFLNQTGLLKGLNIIRTDNAWLLSGQLKDELRFDLDAMLDLYNNQTGIIRPARFIGSSDNISTQEYLPSPISSIGGTSETLYATLVNGVRLTSGSPVRKGLQVYDISPKGITLIGRDRLIFIPIYQQER